MECPFERKDVETKGVLYSFLAESAKIFHRKHKWRRKITLSKTRKFGQHSGLIMAVKQIIAHAQWNRAWLLLVADRFGWFIVKNIFWKKRKD